MKKITHICLVLVMALTCLGGCQTPQETTPSPTDPTSASAPATQGSISYEDLDETDHAMLAAVASMEKAAEANATHIWGGGYDIANLPLVLVRTDKLNGTDVSKAFAFNITAFDEGIQIQTITDLPSDLSFKNVVYLPYDATNPIEQKWAAGYNFDYFDMQGVHIEYVCYYEGIESQRMLYLVTHEGFHEFVQVAHWPNVNDLSSVIQKDDNEYTQELVQYEMMVTSMLYQAMQTTDETELRQILHDTLVLRNAYMEQYPFRETEKQAETIEGTAQYASYVMDNYMAGKDANDGGNFTDYPSGFQVPLDQWKDEKYIPTIMLMLYKDFYYDWGVAYLAAMDRLGLDYVDPIQKQQKLLWDLSMEYFLPEGYEPNEETLAALKEKYNFDQYAELAQYWTEILNTQEEIKNVN